MRPRDHRRAAGERCACSQRQRQSISADAPIAPAPISADSANRHRQGYRIPPFETDTPWQEGYNSSVALPIVKRIREIFESIAYAGLKPGTPAAAPKRLKWLGPLSGPIERFLSGGPAPSDPLYLTNRTLNQKIKLGLLIGIPCLVVGLVVAGMLTNAFDFSPPPPAHEASASEMAAKLLPKMEPNMHVQTAREVEVTEVHVEPGPPAFLVGGMRNTTTHDIRSAEAVFDLTDGGGSQLGAVSARVENLKPGASTSFRIPIQQTKAMFALVRDIHSQ
jgi:hypothetical protein